MFLQENELSGFLPSEVGQLANLKSMWLVGNKLSNELPDVFHTLPNLEWVDLSRNFFSGTLPTSLWRNNRPQKLIFKNNDFTGTIPENVCSKLKGDVQGPFGVVGGEIQVDASTWFRDKPEVECKCCEITECSIWDMHKTQKTVFCPVNNIHKFEYYMAYNVTDLITNLTLRNVVGDVEDSAHLCLSPTGCYDISYIVDTERIPNHDVDDCRVIDVCGNFISPDNPKRAGLNHLTQSTIGHEDIFKNPETAEYKALCWIMTKDNSFEDYEICHGTLLQRYLIIFFYYKNEYKGNFSELTTLPTCEFPGVTCDEKEKFIERLELHDANLTGNLITELGLLHTLKRLDLSHNELSGTIPKTLFTDLSDLSHINLGHNTFFGSIPETLLESIGIDTIVLKENKFTGTLPDYIVYGENLSEYFIKNNYHEFI